jgi:hypothetical protein
LPLDDDAVDAAMACVTIHHWEPPEAHALGSDVRVEHIATPGECIDGFFEAFRRRPESLLNPDVRASQSIWTLLEPGVEQRIVDRLRDDLASGAWDAQHGHLRNLTSYDGALRLVIAERPLAPRGH